MTHPTTIRTSLRHHLKHDLEQDQMKTTAQNRNREMHLLPESLARAHMQERLYEAESERKGRRLLRARRLQRRAERASLRARRALALAVMQ